MRAALFLFAALALWPAVGVTQNAVPPQWTAEWPKTDFSTLTVPADEILSGGPPKDGIPSIDAPQFRPASGVKFLAPQEPVMTLTLNGETKAYPVQILMWHEIVNDTVGGTPVAITYCPLCNSSIVFERTLDDRTLDFGTTGKLRLSDMLMYDRQTESWWQQFTGKAIAGDLAGATLTMLPSRMEAFSSYMERHPEGAVLDRPANVRRAYGTNPYRGYDGSSWPMLFRGEYDGPVPPLAYVVAVGDQTWPLSLVREAGTIAAGDIEITWSEGLVSALDAGEIAKGRDIGAVAVTKAGEDVVYHMPFAFAFAAFHPEGVIHTTP